MGRIDLSKVPENRLLSIAEQCDVNLEKCRTLFDKRKKIYEEITPETLKDLTLDYILGGRTSIFWYKYIPEERTEIPINRGNITEILTFLCGNENPFETERNPELTKTPQIINAQFLDDSNVWILFAAKGRPKSMFLDFDFTTYIPTELINSMLRLNDNIFEVRATSNLAKATANSFFFNLTRDIRYIHSWRFLNLTEDKLIELKDELDATMRSYKGIDESGDYVSREYIVTKEEDIWEKTKFQQDKEGLCTPNSRLMFPSINNPDYRIQIRANTVSGGITFLNQYVSENDINHVYESLKRINVIV